MHEGAAVRESDDGPGLPLLAPGRRLPDHAPVAADAQERARVPPHLQVVDAPVADEVGHGRPL